MARAKTEKQMTTTSIYIEAELLQDLQYAADQIGLSAIMSLLGRKWLNEELEIAVKPRKRNNND